jgi:hypothetical protein
MKPPTTVDIDLEHGVGYVRYRDLADGETLGSSQELAAGSGLELEVVIDRDRAGAVVGIELTSLDATTIGNAQGFAESEGLVFPHAAIGALAALVS